ARTHHAAGRARAGEAAYPPEIRPCGGLGRGFPIVGFKQGPAKVQLRSNLAEALKIRRFQNQSICACAFSFLDVPTLFKRAHHNDWNCLSSWVAFDAS